MELIHTYKKRVKSTVEPATYVFLTKVWLCPKCDGLSTSSERIETIPLGKIKDCSNGRNNRSSP